ncbi:DUF2971 domain-containing protein [Leptospira koniambonensis]|uniref:DUF2971 domain-containing protein n=1 Tax=Leptospira koniambonensis TaxID=2484950 RepID=UPI003EBEE794
MKEYIYSILKKLFSDNLDKRREFESIFIPQFLEKNIKIIDFSEFKDDYRIYFEKYVKDRYLRDKILSSLVDSFKISKKITFTELFQDKLFVLLFSPTVNPLEFFHYTSFDSAISILQSKALRLSGIAGLNDKSETYYSDYLLNKNIINPFHHTRISSFNSRFILSNSLNKDELNQWRLYGDNGCGVCLEFEKTLTKNDYLFVFGKIAYGDSIFRIFSELIQGLITKYNSLAIFNQLDIWKNFVKHFDYQQENELRVLFYNRKKYGKTNELHFRKNSFGIFSPYVEFAFNDLPFNLKTIRLGPKCPDQELNKAQLRYYLNSNSMHDIKIEISKKTHYR